MATSRKRGRDPAQPSPPQPMKLKAEGDSDQPPVAVPVPVPVPPTSPEQGAVVLMDHRDPIEWHIRQSVEGIFPFSEEEVHILDAGLRMLDEIGKQVLFVLPEERRKYLMRQFPSNVVACQEVDGVTVQRPAALTPQDSPAGSPGGATVVAPASTLVRMPALLVKRIGGGTINYKGASQIVSEEVIYRVQQEYDAHCEAARRRASESVAKAMVMHHCQGCGNSNEARFLTESRSGDVICMMCGMVVVQRTIYDGDMYRHFEGEEDKSHHGPRPDPLLSNAENLRTSISGDDSDGVRELRKTQKDIEMNLSNAASYSKTTRQGYKDEKSRKAFDEITSLCDRLEIAAQIQLRAQELFAIHRMQHERINHERILTACILAAYRQAQITRKSTPEEEKLAASKAENFRTGKIESGMMCPFCDMEFQTVAQNGVHFCDTMPADVRAQHQAEVDRRGKFLTRKEPVVGVLSFAAPPARPAKVPRSTARAHPSSGGAAAGAP